MEILDKSFVNLLAGEGSGGGGSEDVDYRDTTHKPQINSVTLSGNKSAADLSLVGDVKIATGSGTSSSVVSSGVATVPIATTSSVGIVKVSGTQCMQISASGLISGLTKTAAQYSDIDNSAFICKGTLDNLQNTYVRAVAPACTTITASSTTATISANTTFCHQPSASGCTYTISTPTDTSSVYNGFILQIDTANSASIAFATDGTPSATISLNNNVTPETGKKYTVTGQWDVLNSVWQLFIIDYSVS